MVDGTYGFMRCDPANRLVGFGNGPSWPTSIPTVAAIVARASSRVRCGSLATTRAPRPSHRATAVSAIFRESMAGAKTPVSMPSVMMSATVE